METSGFRKMTFDNKCPICGKPSVDAVDIRNVNSVSVWEYWMRCEDWHEWRYRITEMRGSNKSIVTLIQSNEMSEMDIEWYKRWE
jgi:hypothetical protein